LQINEEGTSLSQREPLDDHPNHLEYETGMPTVFAPKYTPAAKQWTLRRALKAAYPDAVCLQDLLPNTDSTMVFRETHMPIYRVVASQLETRAAGTTREGDFAEAHGTSRGSVGGRSQPEILLPPHPLFRPGQRLDPAKLLQHQPCGASPPAGTQQTCVPGVSRLSQLGLRPRLLAPEQRLEDAGGGV